jgi:iron(III) transport system ATP-binding protein
MSSVTLSDVSRAYGAALALDSISLRAEPGQVLALLGPSGSGKSTILRLIAGLEPVDAGEVRIENEVVSSRALTLAPEARRVGMVFQDYALFPHLSAAENVAFGLDKLGRAEREAAALSWLDRVGLKARAQAFPHELSGGEQQRVALARALAPNPRAILLDEPFSGLDAVLRAELRDASLAALAEARVTALFVTHDAEDALQIADSIAILKRGRVLQQAPPREVYDHPTSLDAAAALGPVNNYRGRVEGGAIATPFGPVSARQLANGSTAQVVVRIEQMRLEPGGPVRVLDVRPHGASDVVRLSADGVVWRALAPRGKELGPWVSVSFETGGVFVFAA